MQMKHYMDLEGISLAEQEKLLDQMGRKAMTQAEIDEFNRQQLEHKNKKRRDEQEMNVKFAE